MAGSALVLDGDEGPACLCGKRRIQANLVLFCTVVSTTVLSTRPKFEKFGTVVVVVVVCKHTHEQTQHVALTEVLQQLMT